MDSILQSGTLPGEEKPEAVTAMAPVGADIIHPTAEGDENGRAADCRPYEIQII